MSTPWWQAPMVIVDTETTGISVEDDRIVQVAAVRINASGVTGQYVTLVNPGVEIPQGAIDVHGITNERARAEGVAPEVALERVTSLLASAWGNGVAVVAMNAAFDLTLIDRETRRYGLGGVEPRGVVDPLVIDRALDTYRKGSRKLVDLAAHYRVECSDAHDALGDCLTTGRVVWRQARVYQRIADMTLPELTDQQARWHQAWAGNYQEWLRTEADPLQPDAVVDTCWPLRRLALTTSGGK